MCLAWLMGREVDVANFEVLHSHCSVAEEEPVVGLVAVLVEANHQSSGCTPEPMHDWHFLSLAFFILGVLRANMVFSGAARKCKG